MINRFYKILFLLLSFLFFFTGLVRSQTVRIGAKNFNEGYLLAEILAQLYETNGIKVERNYNLGGTLVCFSALKNGEIDVYPEYSGTISEQILKSIRRFSLNELHGELSNNYDMQISSPFGFNNSYALAVLIKTAKEKSLNTISDLKKHKNLKFVFSYEFLEREDGWKNLALQYNLPQSPLGVEHGLAYQALDQGKVDLIDIYTTDGEISRYNLFVLEDDQGFFPQYQALALYRLDLLPKAKKLTEELANSITEKIMQELNARVVFNEQTYQSVARSFLLSMGLLKGEKNENAPSVLADILSKTFVHLQLTLLSLLAAILIAIPLGVFIYRFEAVAKPILYFSGLLQTIPSIALLALMIPLFGIGFLPAIIALFLYALLPILRNTTIALFSIDPLLKKVAKGIGLTPWQRLKYVEIPLSTPTILAGIKTAAVISIGTATLAAFIGAGGLGEFIVTGLSLNNTAMILKGAIPAAILAVLVEFMFDGIEKIVIPKHLQQKMGK